MKLNLVICLHVLTLVGLGHGSSWTYSGNTGPTYWADSYPNCGLSSQSPVNLEGGDYDPSLGNITFTGYSSADGGTTYVLGNNGETATVSFQSSNSMSISNGGLPGTYKLHQFHLHWGSDATRGSEHNIDGNSYAAELHIVHYNTMYSDALAAIDQSQGLAVLGILIKEGSSDNTNYNTLINGFTNIPNSGDSHTLTGFALGDLLPADPSKFFRYSGSLTTPSCYESVVWTVFNEPISLSASQLNALRSINYADGTTLQDNYRPVQALNDRTITASWDGAEHIVVSFSLFVAVFVFHFARWE